ncbi:unnamed protein product [Alopecurus aequalis]
MAALLRLGAARRLGGSVVQRAEEAVADGRRRLGSRLVHTDEEEAVGKFSQRTASLLRDVQQKKEELYDMLIKAELSSKTASWSNLRLLQHLSLVINPRPDDSAWDHVQSGRKLSSVLKKAGLISLPFMVASWSEYCRDYLHGKVAPAMMMEEEHEA